jgi:hypothetical protein
MKSIDYWQECLNDAADKCGLSITLEQLEDLAKAVDGYHNHFSMAFGYDVADRNYISDEKRELDKLKKEQEAHRKWELSTKPCKSCLTTGITRDGWGRDVTCWTCMGEGRI